MFAHRWACLATLRHVAASLVFFDATAIASSSFRAVIEDKLVIQPKVTSGTLDTTNFDQPTILLTTKRGTSGVAYVYRLATFPLQVTDTVAVDSTRDFVRAVVANLHNQPAPDYLVAVDSTVHAIYSDGSPEKILQIPGTVRSLAAGPAIGQIWVGYARDTSYVQQMWLHYYGSVAGLLNFETFDAPGTAVPRMAPVIDLMWRDVDVDGVAELVALWYKYGGLSDNTPGLGNLSGWQNWSYGYKAIDAGLSIVMTTTCASLRIGGGASYGGLFLYGSLLMDRGAGNGGWMTISATNANGWIDPWIGPTGSFYDVALTARKIPGDTVIWTRTGEFGRPFLWDLDLNGSPELLAARPARPNQPLANFVFDPLTGDSLDVIRSDYMLQPWAAATFSDGVRRGLLMRGDTLVLFSIAPAVPAEEAGAVLPEVIELGGNCPNPFNSGTTINFKASSLEGIEVAIYDPLGRLVSRLSSPASATGHYRVNWDGRHESGVEAPSGVYFYRVRQGPESASGRMLLLR